MKIAIVGATGLVGRKMIDCLKKYKYCNENIELFSSNKSSGSIIKIGKNNIVVKELKHDNLSKKYDYVLFSAGASVSRLWAKEFVKRGAVVIDNSSAFRRGKRPLVVPEINANTITPNTKIIANPNCSTIGVCLPLFALSREYKIISILVSTYQAVSGAGKTAIDDLKHGTTNKLYYKIKNNLIPQIDIALKDGYTFEENKMEYELKKILGSKSIKIASTCVRVPIINCHSECVNVKLNKRPNIKRIKRIFSDFEGIKVIDDLPDNKYPMPILANGKNDILVGRIRIDHSDKNSINFFVCFDNLLKGAALNAVQIMDYLVNNKKIYNK
ncbi:MAG: aspartate-semialdehyde dehydrogenase [Clostridia bacterium]|nr:aspartate-semialdehyde dehydrogenase [Clostridia bacterium]